MENMESLVFKFVWWSAWPDDDVGRLSLALVHTSLDIAVYYGCILFLHIAILWVAVSGVVVGDWVSYLIVLTSLSLLGVGFYAIYKRHKWLLALHILSSPLYVFASVAVLATTAKFFFEQAVLSADADAWVQFYVNAVQVITRAFLVLPVLPLHMYSLVLALRVWKKLYGFSICSSSSSSVPNNYTPLHSLPLSPGTYVTAMPPATFSQHRHKRERNITRYFALVIGAQIFILALMTVIEVDIHVTATVCQSQRDCKSDIAEPECALNPFQLDRNSDEEALTFTCNCCTYAYTISTPHGTSLVRGRSDMCITAILSDTCDDSSTEASMTTICHLDTACFTISERTQLLCETNGRTITRDSTEEPSHQQCGVQQEYWLLLSLDT